MSRRARWSCERIAGPTMLEDLGKRPWRAGAHARLLAELHARLHRIPAPDWLRAFPVEGDAVLHLDLHPANVILSPDGPVVIDWTNGARGDAAADLALTWIILAVFESDDRGLMKVLIAVLRRLFLRSFLAACRPGRGRGRAPRRGRLPGAGPQHPPDGARRAPRPGREGRRPMAARIDPAMARRYCRPMLAGAEAARPATGDRGVLDVVGLPALPRRSAGRRGVPRRRVPRRARPVQRRVHRRRRVLRPVRVPRHPAAAQGPARRTGRIGFRRFYARRVRRLLPAAVVALVVTAVGVRGDRGAGRGDADATGRSGRRRCTSRTGTSSTQSTDYFGADIQTPPRSSTSGRSRSRSSSTLVWPLLLAGLFVVARRRRRAQLGTSIRIVVARRHAGVAGGRVRAVAAATSAGPYYGTDTRAYQLLAGALLACSPGAGRAGPPADSDARWPWGAFVRPRRGRGARHVARSTSWPDRARRARHRRPPAR